MHDDDTTAFIFQADRRADLVDHPRGKGRVKCGLFLVASFAAFVLATISAYSNVVNILSVAVRRFSP